MGENLASALALIATISVQAQPMGVGISISPPAWSFFALLGAGILKTMAQIAADESTKLGRVARFTQQLQERPLQANIAGREIKVIDKQIEAQKIRSEILDKDIKTQEKLLAQSKDIFDYLRNKYANSQLYHWLDNSVQSIFYQTYTVTMDLAKRAESAFHFESGPNSTSFVQPAGYWDRARGGLMCAESL